MFGYSFLVGYIVTCMLPELPEICKRACARVGCCVITILFGMACVFFTELTTTTFLAGFGMLALTVIVVFVLLPYMAKQKNGIRWAKLTLLGFVVASLAINGDFRFAPLKEDYISEYNDAGNAYEMLMDSSASTVEKLEDYSTYRIDETDTVLNTAVAQGYAGISFYTSLLDHRIDEFHKLLAINNTPAATVYNFKGLDSRAYLETLLGVKYFTTNKEYANIPYGFTELTYWDGYEESENTVYLNENLMPLAYTYDSYITKEEFESYPIEQRQEILMQSIVLEEEIAQEKEGQLELESVRVPYEIISNDGIEIEGNKIRVKEANATLGLLFTGVEKSETYVKLEGLDYTYIEQPEESEEKNAYVRYLDKIADLRKTEPTYIQINVYRDQYADSYKYRTTKDRLYGGMDDYFMNLGYSELPLSWCKISFNKTGEYTFDELSVICQPMDRLGELAAERTEDVLDNLAVGGNTIAGNIDLKEDKILYLSAPYNSGWTAVVDGKETELLCGNIMGMALPLSAGSHDIVLRYRTPGLKLGAMLTIGTLICLIIVIIINRVLINKKKGNGKWVK